LDKHSHQLRGTGNAYQSSGIFADETTPLGEVTRDPTFDIFKRLPDGDLVWITAVQGLKGAKEQMVRAAAISPGEYFIHLQGTGVVATHVTQSQEWTDVV
jgi:hypothetical protein